MRPVYTDLYALFRRDPGAEEYFNQLPAYVQDQLSARCRAVDSLERLHAYADQFQAKVLRSWWRRSAERPFSLRRSARERYMAG